VTSPMPARRVPPGRYDEPSRLAARALAVVLGLLFVGLVIAVATTLYSRYGQQQVRAQTVGFSVLSDDEVRVDLEVRKDEGVPAYCYVRARGADGAEVGREAVTVDATGTRGEVVRLSHVLTTSELAVTGEVGRCSAEPLPTTPAAP
jgi:hypothetical protein